MRTTAAKLRESLHAASLRLVEAEQRNATLEASLQAQRAQSENDRLELLARANRLEEEQQARAPKVYHEESFTVQSFLFCAFVPNSTCLLEFIVASTFIAANCAGVQVLQRFLTSSKRPAAGATGGAWTEERNQLLKQVRALEAEQRRLLELCASLQTNALEDHRSQLLVLEGYTQQLEADNLELSNRFAEVSAYLLHRVRAAAARRRSLNCFASMHTERAERVGQRGDATRVAGADAAARLAAARLERAERRVADARRAAAARARQFGRAIGHSRRAGASVALVSCARGLDCPPNTSAALVRPNATNSPVAACSYSYSYKCIGSQLHKLQSCVSEDGEAADADAQPPSAPAPPLPLLACLVKVRPVPSHPVPLISS